MTALQLAARAAGLWPLNLEMGIGSLVTGHLEPGSWYLGLLLHLAVSATFGVVYAFLFEGFRRTGGGVGASIGLVHGLLSGIAMAFLPLAHPLMPEQMPSPGAFALRAGPVAATGYLFLHVMFGAIQGRIYSLRLPHRALQPPRVAPRQRRPTEVVRG